MRAPELCGIVESDREELPHILWADDDVQMREYVRALLQDRYVVETVTDGLAALACARARPPDLLLADVMMPRLDGISLISALRADSRTQNVPAILVSGRGDEELKLQAFRAGADDFLLKPFSAQELLARIKSHLELVAMRRQSAAREAKLWTAIELAMEAGRLGYWQLDLVTGAINCSARCKTLYGLSSDEEFSNAKLLKVIRAEDREAVIRCLEAAARSRADFETEYRVVRPDGTTAWLLARGRPEYSADGSPRSITGIVLDITERKTAEEHQKLLMEELNHRVQNTLAAVHSIASLTLRSGKNVEESLKRLEARLLALSRFHMLLTEDNWRGASMGAVARSALEPFNALGRPWFISGQPRFLVEGPDLRLPPKASLALGMALHELATNAAEHGALSENGGTVWVRWRLESEEGMPHVELAWQERGGPQVSAPEREGFGSAMIQRGLAHELSAHVEMAYEPGGVTCTIRFPLAETGND